LYFGGEGACGKGNSEVRHPIRTAKIAAEVWYLGQEIAAILLGAVKFEAIINNIKKKEKKRKVKPITRRKKKKTSPIPKTQWITAKQQKLTRTLYGR
jgi:late competence protein required for DNA uptake (superfamily II DNA/RNA helicase)